MSLKQDQEEYLWGLVEEAEGLVEEAIGIINMLALDSDTPASFYDGFLNRATSYIQENVNPYG